MNKKQQQLFDQAKLNIMILLGELSPQEAGFSEHVIVLKALTLISGDTTTNQTKKEVVKTLIDWLKDLD